MCQPRAELDLKFSIKCVPHGEFSHKIYIGSWDPTVLIDVNYELAAFDPPRCVLGIKLKQLTLL
jgi:hypothetical protein